MIHAYDEVLLERACDSLGKMLDFSVHSLRLDAGAALALFTASGTADEFGSGSIKLICGMSGIELAYEVLERSGMSYERVAPRHSGSFSGEYWYGSAMARAQWEAGCAFERLTESFSMSGFLSEYTAVRTAHLDSLPLDLSESERRESILSFGREYSASAASAAAAALMSGSVRTEDRDTPLKAMRLKNGLSQSGLAKASGIPLRTIQQYEQRQKDLSRARAEYLIILSTVLNCSPSSLLE